LIDSEEFIKKHREGDNDFTRSRKLPFSKLFNFFLSKGSTTAYKELRCLWGGSGLDYYSIPSPSALSKARKKLKSSAFTEASDFIVNDFYKTQKALTWHGYRLVAIDGSTLKIPDTKEVRERFGTLRNQKADYPLARMSQAYDPLNDMAISVVIDSCNISELDLLPKHYPYIKEKDLVLMDRGYPSFRTLYELLDLNCQFCMRISIQSWRNVKLFLESNETEDIKEFKPVSKTKTKLQKLGFTIKGVKLRMIRVNLPNGEPEVLITSLLDSNKYPAHLFKDLYFSRWGVEESYKKYKCRLNIEMFMGKTVLAINQEVQAMVLCHNLTSIIVGAARKKIPQQKQKGRKHLININWNEAYFEVKRLIDKLLYSNALLMALDLLEEILKNRVLPVIKNRKYERKRSSRKVTSSTYR